MSSLDDDIKDTEVSRETWHSMTYKENIYPLSPPIIVIISKQEYPYETIWTYTSPDLDYFEFGESQEDAKQQFCERFDAIWHTIAMEEDDKLSPKAQELKIMLLKLV